MILRKTVAIINAVLTGVVVILISTFFASGGIAENYTDQTFVAPEFFSILVIWGIGASLAVGMFLKNSVHLFIWSLIITWLSIPVGFQLAVYLGRIIT